MTELKDRSIFNSDSLRQPKREIADFVEQLGVPVPKRYDSLEEALATFKPFVVRSEHPQDVKGGSGILDSLFVTWNAIAFCTQLFYMDPVDWNEYFNNRGRSNKQIMAGKILAHLRGMKQDELENHLTILSREEIEGYCVYAGLNEADFTSKISYSYWEMLPGLNRTVMADSAIEGRYHIFSAKHQAPQGFPLSGNCNYFIFEKGEVVKGKESDCPEDAEQSINSLIETYESIRADKTHCPIMELQSARNTHYFLQYHQGVDFQASEFMLERKPKKQEIEAIVVRGATIKGGRNYSLRIIYLPESSRADYPAVLDWVPNYLNAEAMASNRILQILYSGGRSVFTDDNGHTPKSRLLKPRISAVFDYETLLKFEEGIIHSRENPCPEMGIHFISDGRKAYMSRI